MIKIKINKEYLLQVEYENEIIKVNEKEWNIPSIQFDVNEIRIGKPMWIQIQFNKHLMKTYLPLSHLIRTVENSEFKDFRAQQGKWEEKKLAVHEYLLSQALCLEFPHNVFHPHKNM